MLSSLSHSLLRLDQRWCIVVDATIVASTERGRLMKYRLYTEIDIEAPLPLVWTILTDLDHYREWNPFVVSSCGTVAVGARLTNRLQPSGGKPRTFKPIVTVRRASPHIRVARPPRPPQHLRRPPPLRTQPDAHRNAPRSTRRRERHPGPVHPRFTRRPHGARLQRHERSPKGPRRGSRSCPGSAGRTDPCLLVRRAVRRPASGAPPWDPHTGDRRASRMGTLHGTASDRRRALCDLGRNVARRRTT